MTAVRSRSPGFPAPPATFHLSAWPLASSGWRPSGPLPIRIGLPLMAFRSPTRIPSATLVLAFDTARDRRAVDSSILPWGCSPLRRSQPGGYTSWRCHRAPNNSVALRHRLVAGFHTRFGPPSSFPTTLTVCSPPSPVVCFDHSRPWGLVALFPSCNPCPELPEGIPFERRRRAASGPGGPSPVRRRGWSVQLQAPGWAGRPRRRGGLACPVHRFGCRSSRCGSGSPSLPPGQSVTRGKGSKLPSSRSRGGGTFRDRPLPDDSFRSPHHRNDAALTVRPERGCLCIRSGHPTSCYLRRRPVPPGAGPDSPSRNSGWILSGPLRSRPARLSTYQPLASASFPVRCPGSVHRGLAEA
jgi:hypothetical protein